MHTLKVITMHVGNISTNNKQRSELTMPGQYPARSHKQSGKFCGIKILPITNSHVFAT